MTPPVPAPGTPALVTMHVWVVPAVAVPAATALVAASRLPVRCPVVGEVCERRGVVPDAEGALQADRALADRHREA